MLCQWHIFSKRGHPDDAARVAQGRGRDCDNTWRQGLQPTCAAALIGLAGSLRRCCPVVLLGRELLGLVPALGDTALRVLGEVARGLFLIICGGRGLGLGLRVAAALGMLPALGDTARGAQAASINAIAAALRSARAPGSYGFAIGFLRSAWRASVASRLRFSLSARCLRCSAAAVFDCSSASSLARTAEYRFARASFSPLAFPVGSGLSRLIAATIACTFAVNSRACTSAASRSASTRSKLPVPREIWSS